MKIYVRSSLFTDSLDLVAVLNPETYHAFADIIIKLYEELDNCEHVFDKIESMPEEEYEQFINTSGSYKRFENTFQEYYEYIDIMKQGLDSQQFIVDDDGKHYLDRRKDIIVRSRLFTYDDLVDMLSKLLESRKAVESEI